MFPSAEQVGVVINQQEAALAGYMYQVAQQWLPELKRGRAQIDLPEPDIHGNICLGPDVIDQVTSVGMIALDHLKKQIRVDSSEYAGCMGRMTDEDTVLAQDIDAKLDQELQDAIKFKSFIGDLSLTSDQSRARFMRSSTS